MVVTAHVTAHFFLKKFFKFSISTTATTTTANTTTNHHTGEPGWLGRSPVVRPHLPPPPRRPPSNPPPPSTHLPLASPYARPPFIRPPYKRPYTLRCWRVFHQTEEFRYTARFLHCESAPKGAWATCVGNTFGWSHLHFGHLTVQLWTMESVAPPQPPARSCYSPPTPPAQCWQGHFWRRFVLQQH